MNTRRRAANAGAIGVVVAAALLAGIAVEAPGNNKGFWLAGIALAVVAALSQRVIRESRAAEGDAPKQGPVWRLRDGRTAIVRRVELSDAEDIQAFVHGLSNEARRWRFFSPIRELHPEQLKRLVRPDAEREGVFVALSGSEAAEVVAIAQYAAQRDASAWDIAVVVADAWQQQGLGERLIGHLLDHAASAGIARVEGDILRENQPMIGLARRKGFSVWHHPSDATMVRIGRTLAIAGQKTAAAAGA